MPLPHSPEPQAKESHSMDHVKFIAGILLLTVFYMLVTGLWMRIAARIGKMLGISRFLFWLSNRLKNS